MYWDGYVCPLEYLDLRFLQLLQLVHTVGTLEDKPIQLINNVKVL